MKKLSIFLVFTVFAIGTYAITSQNSKAQPLENSQAITTEVRELDDFNKLEVNNGVFEVDITYGSTEEVVVEAARNLHEYIDLDVKDEVLKIEIARKKMANYSGPIKIHIKTAKLDNFELASATTVRLNNTLKSDNLNITSSGAASFEGDVKVGKANINLGAAATATLSGKIRETNLHFSGASQLFAYDCDFLRLNVELIGACTVQVTGTAIIAGNISGACKLYFKGTPVIKDVVTKGVARIEPFTE